MVFSSIVAEICYEAAMVALAAFARPGQGVRPVRGYKTRVGAPPFGILWCLRSAWGGGRKGNRKGQPCVGFGTAAALS